VLKHSLIPEESPLKQGYTKSEELDEISAAIEHFQYIVTKAGSQEMLQQEHGDVESWIETETRELARRLLQGHLYRREAEEVRLKEVVAVDGLARTHIHIACERALASLFGQVNVKRIGYGGRDTWSLFPLDAKLNLPPNLYSHGLRKRVAEEASKNSFENAVLSIGATTGYKINKRQVEELAVSVAQDFEDFYEHRRSNKHENTTDLLVLSFDAKGIVMRQDSLREVTRQAAAKEEHKMKTRLSKGEKSNRKRMAEVATVYTITRHRRSPESVVGNKKRKRRKPKPKPTNKRVWASVVREPSAVIEEAFQEALRRDPNKERKWVILVDGQPQQLKYIHACMERYGLSDVPIVLDFVHVLEYLWKAAYCFESEGTQEAEAWVQERALKILNGKCSDVAAGMRRSATKRNLTEDQRAAVDLCAKYLLQNKEMLKYDEYLRQGFPIATGVIEGACRHLIKDRMALTGARWGLEGAESILKLRSIRSSGDFDEYWEFHKRKELERNHLSFYDDSSLKLVA